MSCVGERGWEGSVVRYVSGADAAEKALAGIPECERGVDTSTGKLPGGQTKVYVST